MAFSFQYRPANARSRITEADPKKSQPSLRPEKRNRKWYGNTGPGSGWKNTFIEKSLKKCSAAGNDPMKWVFYWTDFRWHVFFPLIGNQWILHPNEKFLKKQVRIPLDYPDKSRCIITSPGPQFGRPQASGGLKSVSFFPFTAFLTWVNGLNETRWWFQIFFIFTPTWGRFPIWLIFFKGVETTNQESIFLGKSAFVPLPWYVTSATYPSWSKAGVIQWWIGLPVMTRIPLPEGPDGKTFFLFFWGGGI